jgi:hypothetical protein
VGRRALRSLTFRFARAAADHRGVKAIGQIFKLGCSMAFFAAGAMAGGFGGAVLWTMSAGFFLLALGY